MEDRSRPAKDSIGAYAFLLVLILVLSQIHTNSPGLPHPPHNEGYLIRNIATALFMYQADHEGRYPKELKELIPNYLPVSIPNKEKEILLIQSPKLRYYPPSEPVSNPYDNRVKDTILISYESDQWHFISTIGNQFECYKGFNFTGLWRTEEGADSASSLNLIQSGHKITGIYSAGTLPGNGADAVRPDQGTSSVVGIIKEGSTQGSAILNLGDGENKATGTVSIIDLKADQETIEWKMITSAPEVNFPQTALLHREKK